jgi:hypothetical protein
MSFIFQEEKECICKTTTNSSIFVAIGSKYCYILKAIATENKKNKMKYL